MSSTLPSAGGPRKVSMELWGLDEDGDRLEVAPAPGDENKIRVTVESFPDAMTTRFSMEPLVPKYNAKVVARFAKKQRNGAPKGREYSAPLKVTIGAVTHHSGMTVDLFAELLGESNDARQLLVYLQSLTATNNDLNDIVELPSGDIELRDLDIDLADQPLKQHGMNCGAHLRKFGLNFGDGHSVVESQYYYQPFAKRSEAYAVNKSQIRIVESVLNSGIVKLRALLDKKTAVRVFVAHSDGLTVENSRIQQRATAHFLTIIGYGNGDKFLYIDPWPGGSRLEYTGGLLGNTWCYFMGILELKGGQLVNTSAGNHTGPHSYIVLMGP